MNKETKKVILFLMEKINKKLNFITETIEEHNIKLQKIFSLIKNSNEDKDKIEENKEELKKDEENMIKFSKFYMYYFNIVAEEEELENFLNNLEENKKNEKS